MSENLYPQPLRIVTEARNTTWLNETDEQIAALLIKKFERAEAQFLVDDNDRVPVIMQKITIHLAFLLNQNREASEAYASADEVVAALGGVITVSRLGERVQELELWLDEGIPWITKNAIARAKKAEAELEARRNNLFW